MHAYLYAAIEFLNQYHGDQPMSLALKAFFRADKKYGSRDRRWISEICFSGMRTYRMFSHLPQQEALLSSLLLTQQGMQPLTGEIFRRSEWVVDEELIGSSRAAKLVWLEEKRHIVPAVAHFPFSDRLSALGDPELFISSLLHQPLVWLRCQAQGKQEVVRRLNHHEIPWVELTELPMAVGVHPRAKLDELRIVEDGLAEIQDLSSQQSLKGISPKAGEKWYDACAASGGKSLLLLSLEPNVELTVSDVRPAMLENLKQRLKRNKIFRYHAFSADLASSDSLQRYTDTFDGIIADVPCSGSGTWGRTPEQMSSFTEEKLLQYAQLQRTILDRLIPALRKGGKLVYITCSVYRDENEDQVDYLVSKKGMICLRSGLIEGYADKADTLFAAVLEKQ